MRCQDYEALFSQYIDDELALEERDALRFHLSGCHRCREKLEDMQNAVFAMHSLNTLTPRPDFDDALERSLKAEITKELYAKPFWSRWTDAFEDLYHFGRQGTVQAVFTASMLMTVALGLTLTYSQRDNGFVETAQIMVPELIEPVLAASQLIAPLPMENSALAPVMASMVAATEPVQISLAQKSLSLSDIVPDLDIEALLPLPSGELELVGTDTNSNFRTVSLGEQSNRFSLDPFNRNAQSLSSENALMRMGIMQAGIQTQLRSIQGNQLPSGQQRYILPSIPSKKRITRVSF